MKLKDILKERGMDEENITIFCRMEEKTVRDCLKCKKRKNCSVGKFVLKLTTPSLTLWINEKKWIEKKPSKGWFHGSEILDTS